MNEIDSLTNMVQKPKRAKKPSNFALWFAYGFFNITALLFDCIAAYTAWEITHNYGYTAMTFFAGFAPLMMHEFLFMRAFASEFQRGIAIFGAIISVTVIITVALAAAAANIAVANGYDIAGDLSRAAIIFVIVGAAFVHGLLAAMYFYVDEGIKAKHVEQETAAFFETKMRNIDRAGEMLSRAQSAIGKKSAILNSYGNSPDAKNALAVVLNMLADDDGDGIPNIIDPIDGRKQRPMIVNASETVAPNQNPTKQA